MRVLFVGAENICVSPLASALLFQQQQLRGIPDLNVASGGVGPEGRPVAPQVVSFLADRRIDASGKVSRLLDEDLVRPADLILTTTLALSHRVIADYAGVVSRCFPLVGFCGRVEPRDVDVDPDSWLEAQRRAVRRLGPPSGDVDLRTPDLTDRLSLFELVDQVMDPLLNFVNAGWSKTG